MECAALLQKQKKISKEIYPQMQIMNLPFTKQIKKEAKKLVHPKVIEHLEAWQYNNLPGYYFYLLSH